VFDLFAASPHFDQGRYLGVRCHPPSFNLAGRQAIDQGIAMGGGAVWLKLAAERYGELQPMSQMDGVR